MDLLYARYARPMELIGTYIRQRRFGDFVNRFMQLERDRKKEQEDKDEEWRLWTAYVHSYSDKSFNAWKAEIMGTDRMKGKTGGDYELDDKRAKEIIDDLFGG